MEQNNFLRLPAGMSDARHRARWAEDSGYYSYDTPLHCLYHIFDILHGLKASVREINVWMLSQLLIVRPFTAAWYSKANMEKDLYAIVGNSMFEVDEKHIYDIVTALSMGCPAEYRLTRGEVVEEWRLYCARGGEL